MVEISETTAVVKLVREFAGFVVIAEGKYLGVRYNEYTLVNGMEVLKVTKEYSRDYDFWYASELGQTILGLVNLDLAQPEPSDKRADAPDQERMNNITVKK